MNTEKIKEGFNLIAQGYDEQRKKFIPCFDDYYISMINFISYSFVEPKHIVDLGAGTGLLTKFLYDKYPNAKYTLIDISEEMLEVAKNRFAGNNNFNFIVSDYSNYLNIQESDLIVPGLSIHHLENNDKEKLYNNIYNHLTPKGLFINFDQFNPESEILNNYYNQYWYDQIINSGLPENEYNKWLKRRELDKENTIYETINMLKKSGYAITECVYSYMKFGVIVAQKNT